jgi:NTE family protein
MALDEEMGSPADLQRRPIDCLRDCRFLQGVDAHAVAALAAGSAHFSVPAGSTLFDAGSGSEGFYVVASGRLGVQDPSGTRWLAYAGRGEVIGESGWLLGEPRSARVVALRDSEVLSIPGEVLDRTAARSASFAMAMARLCAERLRRQHRHERPVAHASIFTIVPNSLEVDVADLATALTGELAQFGRAELVWDVRATSHISEWFNAIEEANDFVVYVAHAKSSAWTRQCCRQADTLLLTANSHSEVRPWPHLSSELPLKATTRNELVLLQPGKASGEPGAGGCVQPWLAGTRVAQHHHVGSTEDVARLARLISHRGVGLVLSGGGARGFAHIGVIRALREARVPLDFVGGASIGAIIAAGVAMRWSDEEMRERYRRSFVDTNPVNDYTFPFIALARGHKVSRLLQREFGQISIEGLPIPFYCVSANLSTGRATEHSSGPLWQALRASVAIPGVLPPVFRGEEVLVDGAAINNLPVDLMQQHAPGFVIGVDVGADRSFTADAAEAEGPPLWKYFSRRRNGRSRINIFQVLFRAGMINSATTAAQQRELADLLLKPTLANIDLLNWKAFDRAIESGYEYAGAAIAAAGSLPRIAGASAQKPRASSLSAEIARREARAAS